MPTDQSVTVLNSDFDDNPGFDPDSPNDWSVAPAEEDSIYSFGFSTGFDFDAFGTSDDTVSQSISVTPNCVYRVAYLLSNSASSGAHFFPAADGVVLRDAYGRSLEVDTSNPCVNQGSGPQSLFVGYFAATSTTALLSFGGRNPSSDETTLIDIQITVA